MAELSYKEMRKAVESEQTLMKFMLALPPDQFEQLMKASEAYAKQAQAGSEAALQRFRHEQELKKKELEAQKARDAHKAELEKRQFEEDLKRKNEEDKKRREMEKLEHKLKRETEEEEKRQKIRLQAKKDFEKLDADRIQREQEAERKKLELEEKKREAELTHQRRLIESKLEVKAKIERENEVKMADFRLQQKLKKAEAMKGYYLEKEKELQKIKSHYDVEKERVRWEKMTEFFSGDAGNKRMWNVGEVILGSMVTLYALKTGYPLVQKGLKNYFFRPTLVSRYHRYDNKIKQIFTRAKKNTPQVILRPELQKKMDSIIQSTRNTSSRGGFYGHLMLYGMPGTGKTLFAEKLARESKMDFAIMTGPSFDQFKPNEAIVEIKNLFSWAKKSKRGLLLFIDEADSFLEHRAILNPERVRVLNEWISQTGTETRQFMCVYATNRAEVLDPAIQSRITRSFEFPPPSVDELLGMLQQYIQMYLIDEIGLKATKQWWKRSITKRIDVSQLDYLTMKSLAHEFAKHRFVGRDVTNFIITVAQEAYAHPDFAVTPLMLAEVMQDQIKKKQTETQYSQQILAKLKL